MIIIPLYFVRADRRVSVSKSVLRSTYVKRCIFVILLFTVGGEIIMDNALSQITNFAGTSNIVFRTKYLAVAEK